MSALFAWSEDHRKLFHDGRQCGEVWTISRGISPEWCWDAVVLIDGEPVHKMADDPLPSPEMARAELLAFVRGCYKEGAKP